MDCFTKICIKKDTSSKVPKEKLTYLHYKCRERDLQMLQVDYPGMRKLIRKGYKILATVYYFNRTEYVMGR